MTPCCLVGKYKRFGGRRRRQRVPLQEVNVVAVANCKVVTPGGPEFCYVSYQFAVLPRFTLSLQSSSAKLVSLF